MMKWDERCKLDPKIPLHNSCTSYNLHLATLVIINLYNVMMSQSGDITLLVKIYLVVKVEISGFLACSNYWTYFDLVSNLFLSRWCLLSDYKTSWTMLQISKVCTCICFSSYIIQQSMSVFARDVQETLSKQWYWNKHILSRNWGSRFQVWLIILLSFNLHISSLIVATMQVNTIVVTTIFERFYYC